MIEVKKNGDKTTVIAWVRPPSIYLDHWALRRFASDAKLRNKFFSIFHERGTLLFSMVNVIEISRNSGQSRTEIRSFLQNIGMNWFPIDINLIEVIERENQLVDGNNIPCLEERFIKIFVPLIQNSPLALGTIVDRYQGDCVDAAYCESSKTFNIIGACIEELRKRWQSDKTMRVTNFKDFNFDPSHPTRSIYNGLMRLILKDNFKIEKNHMLDFLHAVVALAYGNIIFLDGHWANLAWKLKLPSERVRIYSPQQVEQSLDEITHLQFMA